MQLFTATNDLLLVVGVPPYGVGRNCSARRIFDTIHFVQSIFEEATGFKVGLATSRDVDDLARARIARSWFGARVFDLKNAKAANFNAVAFDQTIAHGVKKAIHHFGGHIFLAAGTLANEQCQLFFRYCRHGDSPT
jgi:hypothetical protein